MRQTKASKPFSQKKYVPYQEIESYLLGIFQKAKEKDGCVCFRSGPASHAAQSFLPVGSIQSNLKAELSRHDYRDAFFSFSTFKNKKNPTHSERDLENIFAWSVDVDYDNDFVSPEYTLDYVLENAGVPAPNYAEFGHRLRLVYVFEEPLRLVGACRAPLLRGFKFMQDCICRKINEALSPSGETFGCESNSPCSFFRVPGSVNTKDGSTIRIRHIADEKWTMQEIFEEWIPKSYADASGCKDAWYENWKKHSLVGNKRRFSQKALWEQRKHALECIAGNPSINRKRTLFVYGVALCQLGLAKNEDELLAMLSDFNDRFCTPLVFQKVASKYRLLLFHEYRMKNETIAELTGVDCEAFLSVSKKTRDASYYKEKRLTQIAKKQAKFQKIERRRRKVRVLLENGKSVPFVAKKLGVSVSTIKRDIAAANSEILKKRAAHVEDVAPAPSRIPSGLARRLVRLLCAPANERSIKEGALPNPSKKAGVFAYLERRMCRGKDTESFRKNTETLLLGKASFWPPGYPLPSPSS